MKKISMDEIAKKLNISKVTVHKALTNQKGVSEKKRELIISTAKYLGYKYTYGYFKRNCNFLYLSRKLFFMTSPEDFYTKIFDSLKSFCKIYSCSITTYLIDENIDEFKLSSIKNQNVKYDGIFCGGEMPRIVFDELTKLKIPIVCIDYYSPLYKFNYVYLDNYYDSYLLTEYLIKKGHKKIGFIGHLRYASSLTDKYFGFRKALLDNKFIFNKEWHINENMNTTTRYNIDLPDNNLPTAFVCNCDAVAQKLYLDLKFKKIRIPEDISVVSFDATNIIYELTPKLTSIGINKNIFGEKAFFVMQNNLVNHYNNQKIIIPNVIIEQDSVLDIN